MKRNKWLNMGLSLMMVSAIAAGCSKTNTTTTPAATPGASSNANSGEAGGKKLTGEFEIQYFVGGYGDSWWKAAIDEFQKANPDLKIKQSAGAKINDQMKPRWIQGNPPDVVYIDGAGANARTMYQDGQLMDITDWLKTAKNADGKNIMDLFISKPEEYEAGKYYDVPLVFGSWGTFWDRAEFKKNNWEEPKDWESFLAVGDKIKDSGKMSVYIHTGVYPYYINGAFLDSATVVANNYDTSIIKKINNMEEGVFKSEPVMKALDKLIQMRDKGFIDKGSVALNHTDSQTQFLQHKAAFIPNGLWVENEMKKDVPQGFDFGFIPSVTQEKGGKNVAIPTTATMGIAKKAKNPEAAKAFIQFIFTEKQAGKWAEATGALLNVKTNLDNTSASNLAKTAIKSYSSPDTVVAPEPVIPEDLKKVRNDSTLALTQGTITKEEWAKRMEDEAAKQRAKLKK
ncbi:ABC transporter substrate-binding protein [Paenibacillus chitinolyticus]|uniref:ABC transporter substrate-binding protein n=1 Tax=Paenibacillus chitinolyticus TaxID=79263 RepID=UPI003D05EB2E